MRKLLIAAVIAYAAVASQAASVSWGAVNLFKSDGTTKYSSDVQLLAVAAGGAVADAVVVETIAAANGVVASHTIDWAAAVAEQSYDFYYKIVDSGKQLIGPSAPLSALASDVGTMTISFGNQGNYTKAAGNWVNVPEPTSGLLMLLGVAGLALRRRLT